MTERNPLPACLSHLNVILRPAKAAWFVAIHPDMFRCGQSALILGVVMVNERPCFRVRYADGVEDDTPIVNEDFVGTGGLGSFYNITNKP